ncbi:MAG: hypothetical protein AAF805_08270 [Planctomycetota bacterium]
MNPAESLTAEAGRSHRDAAIALAAPFLGVPGDLTAVGYGDLPSSYQTLLAHAGHMTVTLEAWHESLVDVRVAGETLPDDDAEGHHYTRHSLLTRRSDGRVVQSGVMRIALTGLPDAVRDAVTRGGCPLGRILIRSNLLREVEPLALWRIEPGPMLAEELSTDPGEVIYGRTARILVEGRPAVELLEIVKP